jgi:hypothetical protein
MMLRQAGGSLKSGVEKDYIEPYEPNDTYSLVYDIKIKAAGIEYIKSLSLAYRTKSFFKHPLAVALMSSLAGFLLGRISK